MSDKTNKPTDLVPYEVPEGARVFCRERKAHVGPGETAMMPRSWVEAKEKEEESGPKPLEGVPTLNYGKAKAAKAAARRPKVRNKE